MINYDLLKSFSTEKQIAKAWKEYTSSVARNYEEFVSQVNQLVNSIPTDISDLFTSQNDDYAVILDDLSIRICQDIGVDPNRNVFCIYGDQSYFEFVKTLILKYYDDDDEKDDVYDGIIDDLSHSINNYPNDQDMNKILSDINATFHASVVEVAISAAYDQADTLPDRITVARDYISEKFTSGFIDASGYLTERMTMMKNGSTIIDIINQASSNMALDELSTNDDFKISDSSAYQYTGATPTSAYCWDSVGSAITSTVKIAATAVKGIFNGIISIGKKLFNKGIKYIKEVVVDPYDVAELEGDYTPTIQNYYSLGATKITWASLGTDGFKFFKNIQNGPYHMDFACGEVILLKAPGFEEDYNHMLWVNKSSILDIWNELCVHTNAGFVITELKQFPLINRLMHLLKDDYTDVGFNNSTTILQFYQSVVAHLYLNTTNKPKDVSTIKSCMFAIAGYYHAMRMYVCLKPKPIKWSLFKWFFADMIPHDVMYSNSDGQQCLIANLDALLDRVSKSDIQYCDVSSSEQELYNSFVLGYYMTIALLHRSQLHSDLFVVNDYVIPAYRNVGSISKFSQLNFDYVSVSTFQSWGNQQNTSDNGMLRPKFNQAVSNNDFLNVATGTVGVMEFDYASIDFESGNFAIPFAVDSIDLIREQLYEEMHNPLGYAFLPYDKDNANFFDSKFRIKTDQENIDRFNNFITTTVIVIVVAIVATTLVLKLRHLATSSNLKLQAMERQVSQKVLDGSATKKDLRMLRKLRRKTNLLSSLTGNTTQAVTSIASNVSSLDLMGLDSDSLNNEIISLIRGS